MIGVYQENRLPWMLPAGHLQQVTGIAGLPRQAAEGCTCRVYRSCTYNDLCLTTLIPQQLLLCSLLAIKTYGGPRSVLCRH